MRRVKMLSSVSSDSWAYELILSAYKTGWILARKEWRCVTSTPSVQVVPPHLLRLLADGDILDFDVITTTLLDRHIIKNTTWRSTA